ncbi:hypothetical protein [Serratia sp. 14-2641]|uniref:hypothetical protein n=1 Tax=Serratia sp. 14-2641 TaxID=1841657 RepID=UPI00080FC1ED|nr:hypothetical protein [Serratia sp. 14-2641]OCJ30494.1 hypothetical protein A6U95_06190 [Serratia sp. 14-2641]
MNDKWTPSINLDLMDVINTQSIKGVQVGSPEAFIFEIMGEAELPATKLSKKLKKSTIYMVMSIFYLKMGM